MSVRYPLYGTVRPLFPYDVAVNDWTISDRSTLIRVDFATPVCSTDSGRRYAIPNWRSRRRPLCCSRARLDVDNVWHFDSCKFSYIVTNGTRLIDLSNTVILNQKPRWGTVVKSSAGAECIKRLTS